MRGHGPSRHLLGISEVGEGNWERALKHYMINVRFGWSDSLTQIRKIHKSGHATKDDYDKALRAFQAGFDEIRSDERDQAAAFDQDRYRYY